MTTVKVEGLAEAISALTEIESRILDMRPVLEVIGQDIRTLTDDSFENESAPDGSPWAALTQRTIERKRAFNTGDGSFKILQEHGTLRSSINFAAAQQSLEIGSNVPYSTAHQLGTKRIPARPFLPFEDDGDGFRFMEAGPAGDAAARIREQIATWITEGRIV